MTGMDETQLRNIVSVGDSVVDVMRPDQVQTFCLLDPISGEAVAVMLTPHAGDAGFSKPLTVVIPVEKIDLFIELIRTAQARLPKPQGGVV